MAKLIITLNDEKVDEYRIDKSCLTIGRDNGNDVLLGNPTVSSYHAQIITILNDSFIEDLNSTNGTFVNSTSIKKYALNDGDQLKIGQYQVKYIKHRASDTDIA